MIFINNQSLNVDETVRNSVLKTIKDSKNLQEAIEQLEKEKLIWYLIGPLRKDEEVRKQINSKWEADFQRFEQSINAIHEELKLFLPNQSFLAYSTKDNDFNIRFENKEEPIKISDILRASSEGKVYHISLGEDNQITASKKNGNERHYNFTGSGSCEMIINWQAKDSEGNSISCSMTVEVGLGGILKVIGEPKFGDLKFTSSLSEEEEGKILKLVEQNKEVFINGKTLYQAFTSVMDKNVGNQPMQEEKTFIRNPPASPQLPTLDSGGYSSLENPSIPSSRRSSFSFEDEEEYEQEENELKNKVKRLKNRVKELEKENECLRKENAELKKLNQEIAEESDKREKELTEEKQALEEKVKEFRTKFEKSEKESAEKNQVIEQLSQTVGELEQELKDKDSKIADLKSQLKDKESEIQPTGKINEELQEKLKQIKVEFRALQKENTKLRSDMEKIVKDSKDNYEKQLAEKEKELADVRDRLDEEQLQHKELAKEFNQLQKENLEKAIQQPSGKSLADEIEEVNEKKEKEELKEKFQMEIERLKQQLEEKEGMLTDIREEFKSTKESLEQLQEDNKQLEQKLQEMSSVSQKETKEMEIQTDVKKDDFRDLYDKKGKYVRTEISDPSLTHAKGPEKSHKA
ncbi:coiled-coil domain-containing protein [Wolbachia pipientis]|uniref:hypothetical protein n=1 Tax=Wolbachia pipientis TaxID=955 RepID=UPI00203082DE|nr:hypothetical protein [Wolbachia pipientis]MCM1002553.1 hypothetical protein [Wolbachia pipientis]